MFGIDDDNTVLARMPDVSKEIIIPRAIMRRRLVFFMAFSLDNGRSELQFIPAANQICALKMGKWSHKRIFGPT
jgi:hypothetical protein